MNPTPNPQPPLRPRQWVVTALVVLAMLGVQALNVAANRPPAPARPAPVVVTKPAPPAPAVAVAVAVAPDPEIRRLAADYYRLYPAGYATARGATTTPYDRVMGGLAELRTAARDALAAAIDARVKPLVGPDGNYTDGGKAADAFATIESSLRAGLKDASDP